MVGRMAVDPLYGLRARASVLTPVCRLAEHFYLLPKSPSISCSVFTLSDLSLNGQSFHLKISFCGVLDPRSPAEARILPGSNGWRGS